MNNSISYNSFQNSPYKCIKHSTYFPIYDELFEKYRGKKITFVEIGILGGGSLFMWRDYFGPEARIIGIDLNPNAQKWEEFGFEIFVGSQSDEQFWSDFTAKVGMVDLVLDDGGHTYEQQIITTEMLVNNIKDGGLLVVEDTHTSYMRRFGSKKQSFIKYVKHYIDKINHRFSGLDAAKADTRVWAIEAYESIIAFKIDRKKSNQASEVLQNGGEDDLAKDYRYEDSGNGPVLNALNKMYAAPHKVPGSKFLIGKIRRSANKIKTKNRLRKYFR